VRIYADGVFDLPHSGHYNALRQARDLGDILFVGVCSDKDTLLAKGPTILNEKERYEIISHCKFVDNIIEAAPYEIDSKWLKSINCNFYAHGDDPCYGADGTNICQLFKDLGIFKEFPRTEGVSTTSTTSKLLKVADHLHALQETNDPSLSSPNKMFSSDKIENPP
jgi:ethanolamine-phosphate cytidylyltransferase